MTSVFCENISEVASTTVEVFIFYDRAHSCDEKDKTVNEIKTIVVQT